MIDSIKNDFESEISVNDKRVLRLKKLNGELINLTTQTSLFEMSKAEKANWNKQVKTLTAEIQKLDAEIEEINIDSYDMDSKIVFEYLKWIISDTNALYASIKNAKDYGIFKKFKNL